MPVLVISRFDEVSIINKILLSGTRSNMSYLSTEGQVNSRCNVHYGRISNAQGLCLNRLLHVFFLNSNKEWSNYAPDNILPIVSL